MPKFKFPNFRILEFLNFQVSEFPNFQDFQISEFLDFRKTKKQIKRNLTNFLTVHMSSENVE